MLNKKHLTVLFYNVLEKVFDDLKRLFAITEGIVIDNLEFSKTQEDAYQAKYETSH